jgi:5-methyltetrahydropteroyltriglutamate--homocysteine methyltransferase
MGSSGPGPAGLVPYPASGDSRRRARRVIVQGMTEQRILVTIAGSVPQAPEVARLLDAAAAGDADPAVLEAELAAATAAAVGWQLSNGVDVVSDGEVRLSFMDAARFGGFHGPPAAFMPAALAATGERLWAADYFARCGARLLPGNDGAVIYDPAPNTARIARFLRALEGRQVAGAFLAAPSPGTIALVGSSYYRGHEEFVYAVAGALRQEYRDITAAGLTLQVDAPDLAMPYHAQYQGMSAAEFRARARLNAGALNYALAGIDPAQVRMHVCWGNYPGPHHCDIPLADIIDVLYTVNARMLVLEGASPQHRADWRVFADHKLPEGMMLAAGVIDTGTAGVEAPAAVADALVQVAGVVGAERVMAGTDCGFATFGGAPPVVSAPVAELKLRAMRAGAGQASRRLWRHSAAAA